MITPDPNAQMLDDMAQCAYRLGKVFGAEAERAETHERRMEQFELFDRCFFAIRVAIGLQLRLRREARAERAGERETERDGERIEAPDHRDPSDRDPPETYRDRLDAESDRDRERERASFPILLRTLEGVAADAAALPGPAPAALPTLRELLAQVRSEPAPPASTAGTPLKARLAGSATTQVLARPPPSPTPGLRAGLAPRRATGPPRR